MNEILHVIPFNTIYNSNFILNSITIICIHSTNETFGMHSIHQ